MINLDYVRVINFRIIVIISITVTSALCFFSSLLHVGPSYRIGSIHFLATWHQRRPNQALVLVLYMLAALCDHCLGFCVVL